MTLQELSDRILEFNTDDVESLADFAQLYLYLRDEEAVLRDTDPQDLPQSKYDQFFRLDNPTKTEFYDQLFAGEQTLDDFLGQFEGVDDVAFYYSIANDLLYHVEHNDIALIEHRDVLQFLIQVSNLSFSWAIKVDEMIVRYMSTPEPDADLFQQACKRRKYGYFDAGRIAGTVADNLAEKGGDFTLPGFLYKQAAKACGLSGMDPSYREGWLGKRADFYLTQKTHAGHAMEAIAEDIFVRRAIRIVGTTQASRIPFTRESWIGFDGKVEQFQELLRESVQYMENHYPGVGYLAAYNTLVDLVSGTISGPFGVEAANTYWFISPEPLEPKE